MPPHSSGIGFTTVQHLARKGAKVYLGARNEDRAKAAIERLNAEGLPPGNGTVEWLNVDLSDPRKAKKSAESFLEKETRLDVLGAFARSLYSHRPPNLRHPASAVNNAGV